MFALGPLANGMGGRVVQSDDDQVLVILQLAGGNDGLNTVVPFTNDAYGKARRRLRIDPKDILRIDDHIGLHPGLGGLKSLWDDGDLAIVQGVGYPNPNRSHFKSFDVWHAASARGRSVGTGWVGRLCDHAFADVPDPNLVVHIGNRTPFSLYSTAHPPVAFSTPQAYRWIGSDREASALEAAAPDRMPPEVKGMSPPASGRDRALADLRRALRDAQASSETVRKAAARFRPKAPYPNSKLAASLATVSALITGGLSTRVYSVEAGGFDTHANQKQRHDNLMKQLGEGLSAFMKDLAAHGTAKRVTVFVFSEFGRRVAENASGGTDHGTAGPSFVVGPNVKGGLYGKYPSLTDLDKGDLKYEVDFRSIYATLIDRCIGADHAPVLGKRWGLLPVL